MLCHCAICLMIGCTQSECVMPQLKELEQLKLSSSTKVLLSKSTKTQGCSVECEFTVTK